MDEIQRLSHFPIEWVAEAIEAVPNILTNPDFDPITADGGDHDPMILTAGGGIRVSPDRVLSGLLTSATVQIFLLELPRDEATFVRTVLDNFEELRRACRGEKIRAYSVVGISGLSMSQGMQASTPWGVLRPVSASADSSYSMTFRPKTTCILMEQRLLSVKIDRSNNPDHKFDSEEVRSSKASLLFPLSCVLSSKELEKLSGPINTWSTLLLPFQSVGSYSYSPLFPKFLQDVNIDDSILELEAFSRILELNHSPNIDIAATRLVSSVIHRSDQTDSLIDAVMVWENLLGTSSEVTFRVTAALSKLLETDMEKRRDLRKELANIYGIRSRIIHGALVEPSVVTSATKMAIDIAAKALQEFYRRGEEWLSLSSTERSDAILLSND